MTDDAQLFRRYVAEGSEQAFGELVARYINLVYSAAVRQTGDAHLAEDVAQAVFTALARKARALPREVRLGGWLYRHACFVAAQAARTERRRQARERRSLEMNGLNDHSEPDWEQLAPFLDEAMKHLGTTDRDAILLRYFENRGLHDVGNALGVSEDAARKRVTRALEKLRTFFMRRGLTLSTASLATLLAGHAVVAAPTGLAVSVTSAALAGAATSAAISLTLLKVMTMTKLKAGVVGAIVVAGLATPLVLQQQTNRRLRSEIEVLRKQTQEIGQLREANDRLAKLKADANALAQLQKEHDEVMRLRGEVGVLKRQLAERQTHAAGSSTDAGQTSSGPGLTLTPDALQDVGNGTPETAIQTLLWAVTQRNGGRLAELLDYESFQDAAFVKIRRVNPDASVGDVESVARDFVDKLRQQLPIGSFTNKNLGRVVSWRLEDVVSNDTVPGIKLAHLTTLLRDGSTESEKLKLRQSGDQWIIFPSEEGLGVSFTPLTNGPPTSAASER